MISYTNLIAILVITPILSLLASLFWYFWTFDSLLKHQYKCYKPQWEKDGKPNGFIWTSPESTFWQATFRRADLVSNKWLSEKSDWVWEDVKATNFYNSHRILRIIMYFSVVITSIGMFITTVFDK